MYVRDAKRGNPGRLSDDDILTIIERFNKGETMAALAREYGVTVSTVRYHLNKARTVPEKEAVANE